MTNEPLAKARLGGAGPEVARLCLCAMFNDQTAASEAAEIIARYGEAGGNFIETGDADAPLAPLVGRAIEGQRRRWIIAAKSAPPSENDLFWRRRPSHWLRQTVNRMRERLGVDTIDLFYLHFDEGMAPLEEAIETLGEMIQDRKIGGWGFANFGAWQIAELVRMADCLDIPRPIAGQPYYHALYRLVEMDYLPACAHFGIGAVSYAPLARGFLAGEHESSLSQGRMAGPLNAEAEFRPEAIDAVRAIARHLEPSGRAMTGFALQWVLANKLVSSVLIRPKSLQHLEIYLKAATTPYTRDDEAFINELVPGGTLAGSAYSSPKDAQDGRVVN